MLNCAKLCEHMQKLCQIVLQCVKLCQIIILFLMTENYLCQTMPKCSDVCESVQNCAQLYRK